MRHTLNFRTYVLALALFAPATINAQGLDPARNKTVKPTIIVNIGKPNAWTMEQAHYLLERNRAHDLGIAAQDLGPLDANEIVGYRLDALKTLLSVQAQYDQSTGKKNSTTISQYQRDVGRYNDLLAKQDQLTGKQAQLAAQLAAAQYQLAVLQAQTPPDQQKVQIQTAEVTRITALKATVDSQLSDLAKATATEPSLSGLTSSVPTTDATSATAIGTNPVFSGMLQGVPQGLNNSKLQASIKLDNYINLQYEIVAKQLTLLRDEAGPDKRVVFLELPQSIYVTQKLALYPNLSALWGSHLVQTWWRIDSVFVAARKSGQTESPEDQTRRPPTRRELSTMLQSGAIASLDTGTASTIQRFLAPAPALPAMTALDPESVQHWTTDFDYQMITRTPNPSEVQKGDAGLQTGSAVPATQAFYALDLIPRRSALNVAEAHSVSRAYGFAGLFGFLTGLGGKARYERQRDQYDQFAQEEAYASGFGKGQDVFGWTFGPLPGTKRMDPGMRTTYAVLVVPKDTRYVQLTGVGCGYRRRMVPRNPFALGGTDEDCSTPVQYDVEIPDRDDDFFVERAYYRPVPTGNRITLELTGRFGTQVGILVNGTPLQKVVAVGQPMLEQSAFNIPTNAGDSGVAGVYELVGGKQIICSFVMPASFAGTPQIAIVTPAREAVINGYPIQVHDGTFAGYSRSLNSSQTDPMFYQNPGITRVAPVYDTDTVHATIFGQGFRSAAAHSLMLNGDVLRQKPCGSLHPGEYCVLNSGVVQARFDRKQYFPRWHFDYLAHDGAQTTDAAVSYDDDGKPVVTGCTATPTVEKGVTTAVDIAISGQFFNTSFTPAALDKHITVTSTVLTSAAAWDVTAGVPKGEDWTASVLQLKSAVAATDNPQLALKTCKMPSSSSSLAPQPRVRSLRGPAY